MAEERVAAAVRPTNVDALYRAHARSVYAFIYSKVGNREAAEDITADVFMKALTHLDPARAEHSMIAWLFRVARNAIADYWRAGRGASVISLEEALLARRGAPTVDRSLQELNATRARALLDRLPETYRAVLSYRLLEGLTVAETARRMDITESYAKVLQHRALKRAAELHVAGDAGMPGSVKSRSVRGRDGHRLVR